MLRFLLSCLGGSLQVGLGFSESAGGLLVDLDEAG
jgi:hypothetical protein